MVQGEEVQCRINAGVRKAGEYRIKPADKAKKVMVVGGGPAGMEAARVARRRGHEVTLYEKAPRLGGKLVLASVLDEEKASIIRYLSGQMKSLGVKVETGSEATPALIAESRPDVLILATGAVPPLPDIKGINGGKVVSPAAIQGMASGHLKGDTVKNRPWVERFFWHLGSLVFRFLSPPLIASLTKLWLPFGKKVVVMGGNMAGCQLADFLTERSRRVTLLELTSRFASDMLVLPRYVLLDRLARKEVVMWKGLKEYKAVTERGLVVITKDLKEQVIDADTIIPNLASLPHTELFKAMERKIPEIYLAGDCQGSSLILEAVRDGFRIGRSI
jgi:2,4-dienoyl-CoA reductase (NADPH2)